MASIAAASALRRGAAASALRRGAASLHASCALRGPAPPRGAALLHGAAPPHGPGPHFPGPYRFGRPRHCIRGDSGPPTPDEEEAQKLQDKIDSMEKEELQQYAKKVTGQLANLRQRPQCQIDQADMRTVKRAVEETKARVEKIEIAIEKRKDVTSIYIPGLGSVNVLAVGMFVWQVLEKM